MLNDLRMGGIGCAAVQNASEMMILTRISCVMNITVVKRVVFIGMM